MGLFTSEAKRTFLKKREQIKDLKAVSRETIELELFLMENIADRQLVFVKTTPFYSAVTKQGLAAVYDGIKAFYETLLKDGVDKWLSRDRASLVEQWENYYFYKAERAAKNDMYGFCYMIGVIYGLVCFMERELWFNLSTCPVEVNIGAKMTCERFDKIEKRNSKDILARAHDRLITYI